MTKADELNLRQTNKQLVIERNELQEKLKQIEIDKTELTDFLIELGKFGEDQYPNDPTNGLFGTARRLAEKLTGKNWGEL